MKEITVIIGDGISEEIAYSAMKVIQYLVDDIVFDVKRAGIDVYEKTGALMEEGLLESIEKNKVALKGPIGTPIGKGFRSINVELRKTFDLYANIRPIKTYGDFTKYENVDLIVFRENTEDLYAGVENLERRDALIKITRGKSERIKKSVRIRCCQRSQKVTVVTKPTS